MEIIIGTLIIVILVLISIIYIGKQTINDLIFTIESGSQYKKIERKLERVRQANRNNLSKISNLRKKYKHDRRTESKES